LTVSQILSSAPIVFLVLFRPRLTWRISQFYKCRRIHFTNENASFLPRDAL